MYFTNERRKLVYFRNKRRKLETEITSESPKSTVWKSYQWLKITVKKTNDLSDPKATVTHIFTFTVLNVPKIPISVQTRSTFATVEQGDDR